MRRPLQVALGALIGLALAGALALGWTWHRDRARHWEAPAWAEDRFVRLRGGQRADPAKPATWIVPVSLRCPHCLATLRRLHAEWRRVECAERLIALIVDAPQRPGADALRAIPPLAVWWDRDGVWRKRWGHRLYGELIEFDPDGHYLRTIAARDALPSRMSVAPEDSPAPATNKKEGT